jgi:hypothetical protein
MADEVLYETPQIRVTERIVTIGATTYPIGNLTGIRFEIIKRDHPGFFGLFRPPVTTARLFLLLNTGGAHELASEDIEGTKKLRDAIQEAFARRK